MSGYEYELGSGEIRDVLLSLIKEEEEKADLYQKIKCRVDDMLLAFFHSKYGIKAGDIVRHSDGKRKLKLKSFILTCRSLENRPFILAREILPFGLAKPKKYFPQDWMTEDEFVKYREES